MTNGTSSRRVRGSVRAASSRSGRADQQDVRLRELDLVILAAGLEPLVVVVDGDREDLLLAGSWPMTYWSRIWRISCGVGSLLRSVRADSAAAPSSRMMSLQSSMHSSQMKTIGPANELPHLVLALAAERAVKSLSRKGCRPFSNLRSIPAATPALSHSTRPEPAFATLYPRCRIPWRRPPAGSCPDRGRVRPLLDDR